MMFVGPALADESPLEPGVYLIPGGAVDLPCPDVPDGMFASFENGAFVLKEFIVQEPPQEVTPVYILTVSPWQIRKALNATGLRALVETAVASADQTTQDAWEFAQEFRRDNPLIASVAAAIGKTDAEIDALFELAASL